MNKMTTDRHNYLSQVLTNIVPPTNPQLQALHTQAIGFLQEQSMPTNRDEEWRFTDLSALGAQEFSPASSDIPAIELQGLDLPEATDTRLVFVNGNYAAGLSSIKNLPTGVTISTLQNSELDITNYLGKQPGGEELFTAINTAAMTDLAIVQIGKNIDFNTPIQILHLVSNKDAIAMQSRCLVVMEAGSNATVIEEYRSLDSTAAYFDNSVTEIYLGDNARLNHTRIQAEAIHGIHIGKTAIAQARDSHYTGNAIDLGAKLARHNWEVFQTGTQTETILNGLAMIQNEQISDTHSCIALAHPHGKTDQLHKCIITDRAHAIFNGKVFVPQAAQLTDAAQLNRNLLLSDRAKIDTKPQLEITADNVKCSHGATVSQLEDDEIFYLQSRGLDAEMARGLLINAFAVEIIDRIPINSVKEQLATAVIAYRSH
jgi:Fe-S cluster assembly protein SufD